MFADLHPGNVGTAVPEIVPLSIKDVWRCAGRPQTLAVIHSSLDLNIDSYPPYLCGTLDVEQLVLSLAPGVSQRPLSIRILDLGNGMNMSLELSSLSPQLSRIAAYFVNGSPSPKCITPMGYLSPEVAFAQIALGDENAPWDQRSDIWSLAVCVRVIYFTAYLFLLVSVFSFVEYRRSTALSARQTCFPS